MSGEKPQDTGGLSPQYHTYERQKCFIAYTEQAEWSDDLLSACQEVLARPEFNLEPDYARKHFYPDVPLRQKALELIANARYGIYDLSYWRDEEGGWHLPCNVFIELGMAIALNRPTLLLRHANNRELDLPACLKSVSGHILEFSGQTTLRCLLQECLPQWVNAPPERDWWNRYCIFGGRVCEYREAHPCTRQWGKKTLHSHISDGPDVDRDDFRGVVEEVLGRFSDVTYTYLDAPPMTKGYDFLLCAHCQIVRSTPFAIYRITSHTLAETFIAIGMSIALEKQFEYKIPKILLTQDVQDVPSLLSGYEVVVARSDKDRKTHLRTFMPTVMRKVRETAWKPRPLPFIESALPVVREVRAEAGKPLRLLGLGDLSLNLESRHLIKGELTYELTPKEFELLQTFMRSPGRVLSRKFLMKKVWETDYVGDTRTLDVHIRRLREKIEDNPSNPLYLRTVRGVGYRFESIRDLTWAECLQQAVSHTSAQLASHTDVYQERFYTSRESESWLLGRVKDNKPGIPLWIVGALGVGKTNLLCHIAQQLSIEQNMAVFLYFAADLRDGQLKDLLSKAMKRSGNLGADLESLDVQWREQGSHWRLVLIVDGINEHQNPEDLKQQLDEISALTSGYPWFKLIASSRSEVFDRMGLGINVDVQYLNDLSGPELHKAYEKYRIEYGLQTPFEELSEQARRVIKNPLMMRMLANTYSGGPIPAELVIPTDEDAGRLGEEGIAARTGVHIENQVAELYTALGAEVESSVRVNGAEVDLIATFDLPNGLSQRIAIEVRSTRRRVDIHVVRAFSEVLAHLRTNRLADQGAIVSVSGFSAAAHEEARAFEISLLTLADLEAQVQDVLSSRVHDGPQVQTSLRVFLASPGDVTRERELVKGVVEELNNRL